MPFQMRPRSASALIAVVGICTALLVAAGLSIVIVDCGAGSPVVAALPDAGLRRLKLAGADQVIAAYQWAGMRIAASILRPSVVDFLQLSVPGRESEVDLEEIRVESDSPMSGTTIAAIEREYPRVRVVALKRGDQPISMIPDPEGRVEAGDFLVVIGESTSLKRLGGV